MRILHISVLDKKATYASRDGDIVCGNSDYVIEFAFDAEWDAHEEKIARFIWNGQFTDVDFTGNTCPVPIITNATAVEIGVYAGELSTTTPAVIGCQKSILCKSATESGEIVFDRIPHVSATDNDKILMVIDGKWQATYMPNITDTESGSSPSGYKAIRIISFSDGIDMKEYGEAITDITLTWELSKDATTLQLNGESLAATDKSITMSDLSITHDNNAKWTLVATDERGAQDSMTIAPSFANGIYYGAAAKPEEYNNDFVLGLTKVLQKRALPAFTASADENQYIYYALPTRLGKCSLSTSAYDAFELASTIAFTNVHGYTENYYVYKSVNANIGYRAVYVAAYVPPSTGGGTSGGSGGTVTSGDTTYYGAVTEPAAYNSAFFNSLTKVQTNGKVSSFTVDAGNGEYIYYALPTRLGMCQFTLGSFTGGFELADIVKADNGKGGTEDYYIFKSEFDGLGLTTLSVS